MPIVRVRGAQAVMALRDLGLVKVSEKTALHFWLQGVPVVVVGNKVNSRHFFSGWRLATEMPTESAGHQHDAAFFRVLVNQFNAHTELELGRAAFFVESKYLPATASRRNPATLYDPTMQTRMRRAAVEHYDERDTLETLPAIGYAPAGRSGVQVVRTRVIPTGGARRGKPAYAIGSRRNPSSSVGSLVSASHLRPGDTIELEDLGRTHVIRGPFRSSRGIRFENQYGNSLMLMPGERVRLVARENPRRRARRRRRS